MRQLLILSGKGGTGKTTVASAFIDFADAEAFADCDVDAPNLHLVMHIREEPEINNYFGMGKAEIDQSKCISCGLCMKKCRFDSISFSKGAYHVGEFGCEGCGVCVFLCPQDAIDIKADVAGELRIYKNTRVFSTATLKMGSGTSGKLVTEVKKNMQKSCNKDAFAIIDGSPGIGCPVIASISGVDMVLIVAEPSVSGISDMERIIKTAKGFNTKIMVCINKYDTNLEKAIEIEEYCKRNDIPFMGKISYDDNAAEAINKGMSLGKVNCRASNEIKKVYQNTMKYFNES
ncbi:ATP-binding protein [Alkalibacter saccharofermentans]|uniref:MinD superfamily P-loop ATPase, contains an inserted ferredoxin domain n=1 Tax=Alkalibacter saccharofermentans DSM 14828 TaxID=1120975 RepID=A0A1M4WK38_9FIRM|nr:ATP-binding protein [Alkalibacter saccharofermentans]SHE81619.1 MinD superfamily P-loop ATPase, contains an inserted ferredoxin domain [Alkalibacter saccharofermentans DSM 14828]